MITNNSKNISNNANNHTDKKAQRNTTIQQQYNGKQYLTLFKYHHHHQQQRQQQKTVSGATLGKRTFYQVIREVEGNELAYFHEGGSGKLALELIALEGKPFHVVVAAFHSRPAPRVTDFGSVNSIAAGV